MESTKQPKFSDMKNLEILEETIGKAVESEIDRLSRELFDLFVCKMKGSDVEKKYVLDEFKDHFLTSLEHAMAEELFMDHDATLTDKQREALKKKINTASRVALGRAMEKQEVGEERKNAIEAVKESSMSILKKCFDSMAKTINRGIFLKGTITKASEGKDNLDVNLSCFRGSDVTVPMEVIVLNQPILDVIQKYQKATNQKVVEEIASIDAIDSVSKT